MKEKEEKRLKALKLHEENLYNEKGLKYICGIDEVGRGPLAGPVVVGAIIMPRESMIEGVNDSKKISESKREAIYEKLKDEAIAYGIGIVDNTVIDDINILNATKMALTFALKDLGLTPDLILVDALKDIDTLGVPYISEIKGDAKEYSISAASILAKVTRDRLMREYDKVYPEYDFSKNKGYGTSSHIEAIKKYGLCKIHRRSFIKDDWIK